MKPIKMPALQQALDAESYEWLAANSPIILEAVEREVSAGRKPEQIRLFVLLHTSRLEIAMRCEQVARHGEARHGEARLGEAWFI